MIFYCLSILLICSPALYCVIFIKKRKSVMALDQHSETPSSINSSTSKTDIVKKTHTLQIRGFSFTKGMGVGKYISSDTFSVGGHLWQIQFYPDGKYEDESGDIYVSFYIALVSKCDGVVEVYFEYVLLDQSGNKWNNNKNTYFTIGSYMSGPHTFNDSSKLKGYLNFYKRTELEESQFIKDDCLTIQCTVAAVVNNTSMDGPKMFAQPLPLSELGESYGQLLRSKEGSDVSFEVDGETFYAHKIILSTRSPVFKAQFFGPLKEENTQCIKIQEMQAPVFKALLHFIYCDVIPDMGEELADLEATMLTQHLLVAADRYGIEKLKSLYEARLCEKIAVDTVASTLALADQHSCFQLKSKCIEFILLPENLKAVIQTNGFKNLKENCPAVIAELLESIARLRDYTMVSYGPDNRR